MDPAPQPPSHTRSIGFLSRIASSVKLIGDTFGNLLKIGFNILLTIFLISIIGVYLSESNANSTALHEPIMGSGETTIALIDLTGTILDVTQQDPFSSLTENNIISPRELLTTFEEIKKDQSVKAVILRINSPGGSVTASEELYQLIKRFREETGLPVIASQGEIAASGGYYISLAADTIIADPTTVTGSIGVIAQFINIKDLADAYGVKQISITSGGNKSFLNPLEDTNDEQVAILKTIVDEAYVQFLERITESRGTQITPDTLTRLADGRPLTGKQASEAGLVDQTGNFYDSIEFVRQQIGVPDAQVVPFGTAGFLEHLLSVVSSLGKQANVFNSIPAISSLTHLSGTPSYLYVR